MNIVAYNPETNYLEKSYLGKSYASGVSAVLIKNSNKFAAGQKVLIGSMGRERSEILTVNGTGLTATNLPFTTNTVFPHDADDPVFVLDFDKVRFYRSTTGQNGVYSVLATVDMDVDNADNATYYDDVNALTSYWYQVSYYDSVNSEESDRTDPMAAGGYTKKQLGFMIPKVAKEVGDAEFIEVDLDTYISWMNDINSDLITQAKRPYRFLKTSASLNADADASVAPFPDNFWKVNYIEVNEIGPASSRVYRPTKVSMTQALTNLDLYTLGGDYVDGIAVDDETESLVFFPKARVQRLNAFTLHYYKDFDDFTSLADVVETPNTLVYKLGLKREYYMLKADSDTKYFTKAKDYDQRYQAEVMKLQREKNIMADGPTGMSPDRKRYPQFGGRRYRQ